MEAHRHFGKSASAGRGLNNRRTAVLVAVVSALAAAVLIYLFITHYRKNTPSIVLPQYATVMEAKRAIPAGTSETQLATEGLLAPRRVPTSQAILGALSDPSAVAGQTTSVAVEAGQQITAGDFTKTPVNALAGYLKGDQRGVAFTLDNEHGLTSYLQPNDTVDVMAVASNGASELLIKDVTIIANSQGLVTLRLTDKQALLVTGATSKYTLWLAMRPTVNATNSVPVGSVGQVGKIG